MIEIKIKESYIRPIVWSVTIIVLALVTLMFRTKGLDIELPFDVHLLSTFHAVINASVSVLLLIGLYFIKQGKREAHQKTMLLALGLSVLFLLSYVAYHSLSETTKFGGEGTIRYLYYFVLLTHVVLAGISLPFILSTTLRALSGNLEKHRKLARWTWPMWFYVSVSGVIVYLMISPYYV